MAILVFLFKSWKVSRSKIGKNGKKTRYKPREGLQHLLAETKGNIFSIDPETYKPT